MLNKSFTFPATLNFPSCLRCNSSRITYSEVKYLFPDGYSISSFMCSSNLGSLLNSHPIKCVYQENTVTFYLKLYGSSTNSTILIYLNLFLGLDADVFGLTFLTFFGAIIILFYFAKIQILFK